MRIAFGRRNMTIAGAVTFLAGAILLILGLTGQLSGGASGRSDPGISFRTSETPVEATASATPTAVATATATATTTPPPEPPLRDNPYRMVIDSIKVNGLVQTFGLDRNGVPEVPTGSNSKDPRNTIAWYSFSARPGTGSNAVFAAHVTWFGNAIFAQLDKVQLGDKVRLRGQDGTELVYSITDSFMVDAEDPEALRLMQGTDKDIITIITCDPNSTFTNTGDPVFGGEYAGRRIVRASLESVSRAQS